MLPRRVNTISAEKRNKNCVMSVPLRTQLPTNRIAPNVGRVSYQDWTDRKCFNE
jgi:hypothetical protein